MAYNLQDKKDIIFLKNQLIHGDVQYLKTNYSNQEEYALFIDTLNIALDYDPFFFITDDFLLEKAMEVVQNKRFDYKIPEYFDVINEVIERVNKLKKIPERNKYIYRKQYAKYQQELRETSFTDLSDFLGAIAYDAVIIHRLENNNLNNLEPVYFFGSTNFLAKTIPEFYQEDANRIEITMKKLDEHASKKWPWNWAERSFAKGAIKNIQKVKIKEE